MLAFKTVDVELHTELQLIRLTLLFGLNTEVFLSQPPFPQRSGNVGFEIRVCTCELILEFTYTSKKRVESYTDRFCPPRHWPILVELLRRVLEWCSAYDIRRPVLRLLSCLTKICTCLRPLFAKPNLVKQALMEIRVETCVRIHLARI